MTTRSVEESIVTLAEVAQLLQATEQPSERITRALERLREVVPYDRCSVVIRRPTGPEVFAVPAPSGEDDVHGAANIEALLSDDEGDHGRDTNRPGHSHIALPLVVGDAPGVIFVERAGAPYDENALKILSVVGSQLATYVAYCHLVGKLREQMAYVARANEFHQLLVAIVSHDLRNPLSAVLAGMAMLKKRARDGDETTLVSRMTSATQRALRIINDLLDMTRGRTSGAFAIAPTRADVAATVRELVEELRLGNPGRDIVLLGADEPIESSFDGDRLAQAIGNLLSNALHHGGAATPVRVSLRPTDDEVSIVVWNAGTAIPGETLTHIFDPFKRASTVPREGRRSQGLGLGLYIVHQIARAHGGRVDVASGPTGTEFRFTISRR